MRKPQISRFVFLCRRDFETYLHQELAHAKLKPAELGPGAVECEMSDFIPVYGRAGFRVIEKLPAAGTLEAWAADGLPLPQLPELPPGPGRWVVCNLGEGVTVLGDRLTAAPRRMKRDADTLSRAALKLDEALEWVGDGPGAKEVCVDLGAAPGGWSQRLLARGARVIAVDPAQLKLAHKKLTHVQDSAFRYQPEEPVDWLFCDMAWRPLEVAQLLGKWARHGWAIRVVANIKLPMKDKWPMLARVRSTMEEGGWRNLKMRQLYHDRDEVTVAASRY
ncbi:MAG: 23S rRNA (cytidine(2498)-2'-O)-methyltransferase RlmM [Archangiaceae bacterium]|nr:23S rRNA (cytidine(2498)-2'-O)-methyltransferase RlmM [Archangiaceae bacterium]